MCIAIISTCISTIAKCISMRDFGAQIDVEVDVPSITLLYITLSGPNNTNVIVIQLGVII